MCERRAQSPGNNPRTAQPSNNGPPPHNWTVLWEPSAEAHGKRKGGCLEVLHCSLWMMGIMGVCDAGCSFFSFFFKEVQSNILSGQAGDSVPSAAGTTIELPACMKGTTSSVERQHSDTHKRHSALEL